LEVSDVPEMATKMNAQGRREVGALQGFDDRYDHDVDELMG